MSRRHFYTDIFFWRLNPCWMRPFGATLLLARFEFGVLMFEIASDQINGSIDEEKNDVILMKKKEKEKKIVRREEGFFNEKWAFWPHSAGGLGLKNEPECLRH